MLFDFRKNVKVAIKSGQLVQAISTSSALQKKMKFTDKYTSEVSESRSDDKITIVGVGAVGIATSVFLLTHHLTQHLVMFDLRSKWIKAEALDLLHASSLLGCPKIETCSDGSHTKNSKIVVVTAGARIGKNESRLAVAQTTYDLLASVMPKLVKLSPKATYIICSNPCDVMTWAMQKLCKLPLSRCFSSGCWLDSLRFRYFIGKRLKMAASLVDAYVIGEHGNHSVPVWSGVTVGGVPLLRIQPEIGTKSDKEKWSKVHEEVIKAAYTVIRAKGYTNWAVALAITDIVRAMRQNCNRVVCVATNVKGHLGIKDNVFLSLPCTMNSRGINTIIKPPLTDFEKKLFMKSADAVLESQCSIKFKKS